MHLRMALRTQEAAERHTPEEEEHRTLQGVARRILVEERRRVGLGGSRSRRVLGGPHGRCHCSYCSRCLCAALGHILQASSVSIVLYEA